MWTVLSVVYQFCVAKNIENELQSEWFLEFSSMYNWNWQFHQSRDKNKFALINRWLFFCALFCFSYCLSSQARQKRARQRKGKWRAIGEAREHDIKIDLWTCSIFYTKIVSGIEIRKFMRSKKHRERERARYVHKLKRWWCIINAAIRVQSLPV